MQRDPEFEWQPENRDVVVQSQAALAVYLNPLEHVVVRQEGHYGPDEDAFIIVAPHNALALAQAILDAAGIAGDRLNIPASLPESPVTKAGHSTPVTIDQGECQMDGRPKITAD